ncbi:NADP-dependent oxidoreductase [Amycolatopsis saalfeldensis]|uniref:NADPH:quinone reductase n=1 Tax=Amycolatopsis saalfeldensis TaxID=394193 RepID=A0A1H8XWK9_9PSEU|nr:NADP-dependent oxidoreductase [Amycolatopsis saalfeldensis]SEP44142.1 NADPH:quinone reductase [Amycolatopsis saalfeldensis]
MFAVQFERFGPPGVLAVGTAPEPRPGPGQVRIAARTAAVSPVDLGLRSGGTAMSRNLALPHIPGVDAAGVIDEVGAGVTGCTVGDEVFGAVDVARLGGASARFVVLDFWAAKPKSLSWAEAGAAGTSVETATRALDLLDAGHRATLLVDGAAGGVGSIVVQLAVARGARVIGTARPESHRFLEDLGAEPVDYGPGLPARVRALATGPVDRALDVAGAGSLAELIDLTGATDRVVTLADFGAAGHGVRLSTGRLGGQPDGVHGLATAAALADQGRFRVPVREIYPASQAAEAHETAAKPPRRGKVVLDLRDLGRP